MGDFRQVAGMFRGVSYNKFTSKQLTEAMNRKVSNINAKIAERKVRITKITKEHKITDAMLGDFILQYMRDREQGRTSVSYSNSIQPAKPVNSKAAVTPEGVIVPAGVIANLVTEKELIENETMEVKRLELILRNLKDTEHYVTAKGKLSQRAVVHTLTDDEITYLGF